MPGIDYSQPILGAGASAQTDFAAADARAGLNVQGFGRFKRGINTQLGVEAFADASAELSKFVKASIEGTAFARVQAGIQIQLPLNLFDEFGFAARAEAIAEAAAGLDADLGLSIGDFILLAQRDQDLIGLPLELLLLFLEEVSIGGTFKVNVSASAKAHASITVIGCVVETTDRKAGFFYTVDAGVGLAAGIGVGLAVGAEFEDFRRFYGRATDKSVDATIYEIRKLLPSSAQSVIPILDAFAPVTKISLRIAYDIGQKIADNNPPADTTGMNTLCNESVKTILEECQRFILQKMLDSALLSIRQLLEQKILGIGQQDWDEAMQERTNLASVLLAMPDEPFQPTDVNVDYWKNLISKIADLFSKLYGDNPDPDLVKSLSVLYCASELLLEAVRSKLNKASAYATAIGAGTVRADTQPFQGALAVQPIPTIKKAINANLGKSPTQNLSYADLLQFLADDLIINPLLDAIPEAREFLSIFNNDFSKTENEILKIFLQNAGSFVSTTVGGEMDPHETLRLIVNSLDRFITVKFKTDALPIILENISDPNIRLYINEVLFAAVVYIKDVALKSILNWEAKTFDNDDFTESLAGVMTLLLGRTVVIIADTFLTAAQEAVEENCNKIAHEIRSTNKHNHILQDYIPMDQDFIRLAADTVQIGGVVLGPLPDDTRRRVRQLLYQVFEPIPPGDEQGFLDSLSNDLFIPNSEQMGVLTDELVAISKDRFGLFVEKFVLVIGNYILEQIEEFILWAINLVLHWETHLAEVLEFLAEFLNDLEDQIRQLNEELIDLFISAETALREFFDVLSGPSLKSQLKIALKNAFVTKALGELEENNIYKNIPREFRSGVRSSLRSVIDGLIDNPIVNPVLDAIRVVADTLEDLLPDCRELDPEENLPEQVMLLVLDRIEDNIRAYFGNKKPHLDISLDFSFTFLGVHQSVHIPLGRIEFNLNPFLDLVRNTIEEMDFYHSAFNTACFQLAKALAAELELAAAELRKNEAQDEKQKSEKIFAEHDNQPREIAVLNPLSLSHHSQAINVKIHLGGVPLAFLGLDEDESQRVLIFLNGELIPVKSLLVEESINVKNPEYHLPDFDLMRSKAFNSETGIFKNGVASIVTDTAKYFPTQVISKKKRDEGVHSVFNSSEYRELAVARSLYVATGKIDGKASSLSVNIKKDKEGRRVNQYEIQNNIPGRGNAASRINDLLKDRMAGILLQFRVELDELVEGVNVLTVVVIEKGGNRHQQNVSFTVSKPSIKIPIVILPGSPINAGMITLRPAETASKTKKQPKKPHMLTFKHKKNRESGMKDETMNTLLPIDAENLKKKNQEAVEYLQDQDNLNFSRKQLSLFRKR